MATHRHAILVLSAGISASAALGSGSIQGVGTLPEIVFSEAAGISANGAVVTGTGHASGGEHAWLWTASGGLQLLGDFPNTTSPQSYAAAVNVDGSVIVGRAVFGSNFETRPFRWVAGAGLQNLGTIGGATVNSAAGLDGEGALVVGTSGNSGFRWTQAGGLQAFNPGLAISGLSRDGLTVVGATSSGRAAAWSAATGLVDLGQPGPPSVLGGNAVAASADGSVVIGFLSLPGGPGINNTSGFRWTHTSGLQLVGVTNPISISRDGQTIVGQSVFSVGSPPIQVTAAALWTPWLGTRNLNTYLPTLGVSLAGWNLLSAVGISDDGRVICGNGVGPTGYEQAWVVTLNAGIPGCYANCDQSTAPPTVNINDFQCFLNRFAVGDPYANCDGSTTPPVLNANDFQCFLNKFAAGCA